VSSYLIVIVQDSLLFLMVAISMTHDFLSFYVVVSRAGLKGRGARGNFFWRAPMTKFMTSSFVKVTFSLIRKVPVCFFR